MSCTIRSTSVPAASGPVVAASLALLASIVLVAPAVRAQSCTAQAPADHELHPVWGGETRGLWSWDSGAALHIWTGEDGGRIRKSIDGGATWTFADTPDDFTGSVLKIEMEPDGQTGIACGRGGRILETSDGGLTWTDWGEQVLDPCGDPATIWSVHRMTDDIAFAVGLWLFVFTVNGGQDWAPVPIYEDDTFTNALDMKDFHFYDVDVIGSLGDFKAIVAAEWEAPGGVHHGVVLHTDASDPISSLGRRWWITLDDLDWPVSIETGAVMTEPWAARYARGSTTTASRAYVVGGPGGNNESRWYVSDDHGRNWLPDGETNVTMYSVDSDMAGNAMIVGYSGGYLTRNGNGTWTPDIMPTNNPLPPNTDLFRGALLTVHGTSATDFVVGGSFGVQRTTSDYGGDWTTVSPHYGDLMEKEWRLSGIHFDPAAPDTGFAVGQGDRIVATTDGGCTWDLVQTVVGASLRDIVFRDSREGIAVGQNGSTFSTTTGGTTEADWSAGAVAGNPNNMSLQSVSLVGDDDAWAVGSRGANPIVLHSTDDGATWDVVTPPSTPGLRLQGVAFASTSEGLVVGWSQSGGGEPVARAYRADVTGGSVTWTDVSPPAPAAPGDHQRKLLDVALSGGSLAFATAYAVGNGGMVLAWDGAGFTDVPAVYDLDEATGEILFRELEIDLEAVDLSPSGQTVLAGGQYDMELEHADDKGVLLRRDVSGWARLRAHTGKDVRDISLTSDTEGWLVGLANNLGSTRPEECDDFTGDPASASFDNGNLADAIILHYLADA